MKTLDEMNLLIDVLKLLEDEKEPTAGEQYQHDAGTVIVHGCHDGMVWYSWDDNPSAWRSEPLGVFQRNFKRI